MKVVDKYTLREVFEGDEGESLEVSYDNTGGRRGYTQGATFDLRYEGCRQTVYLTNAELRRLHTLLGNLLEAKYAGYNAAVHDIRVELARFFEERDKKADQGCCASLRHVVA